MAAIVTGLIPILRTAVDATASYKARTMWFGLLCVRLVILFLGELPFTKLDADFSCNGTADSRQCFNRHFHKPMMMAWNFIFVLVVLTVLLMELFTSHLLSAAQKRRSRAAAVAADVELEQARAAAPDPNVRSFIDLHKDRGALAFYLLSIVLRIAAEACFMYVLLSWNLPALGSDPYRCSPGVFCVVRAAPEKRMSIYALSSISGLIIVCSVLFCLYSIAHYLCLL
uniref:Si:rp71-1c10.10 n=2 Tax=Salarias fasciatus TaxID=181472 RepID=A0A672H6U3_SALFA